MTFRLPRLALITAAALLAIAGGAAFAERADSSKPTLIDADSATGNEVTQTRTLVGNVVLQRGTLLMKAGRAVIKSDPEGYVYATFYADPGKLATFRQKRDGGDIWDEGEAERIEYDNKLEIVKMFSQRENHAPSKAPARPRKRRARICPTTAARKSIRWRTTSAAPARPTAAACAW